MKETKFKQTDIGLIPEDWTVKCVKEVADNFTGLTYSPNDVKKYGTIVLRSSNIQNGKLCFENNVFVEMDIPNRAKNGDILICVRNGSSELIGKSALIPAEYENVAFGAFMTVLRSVQVNNLFLLYIWQTSNTQRQIHETFGATINQITDKDFSRILIPLPPTIEEQERIANALSQVDDLLAALDEQIEKKKLIKQGTMQQLLTGKTRLKGFDGEWETVKLGQLLDVEKGQQVNGDELNDFAGFPMMNGGATLSGYYTDYNCEADNIIISEGGNSCGFVNYMRERFWAGGHCYIVSLIRKDVILYMYNLLKYNENWIMALRVGSGLPNIQRKDLLDYDVLYCCDINEQQAIASTLSTMDEEIQALQEERDKYALVKQGMMQQLLTGKIRLN